jgi:hypothetical protein
MDTYETPADQEAAEDAAYDRICERAGATDETLGFDVVKRIVMRFSDRIEQHFGVRPSGESLHLLRVSVAEAFRAGVMTGVAILDAEQTRLADEYDHAKRSRSEEPNALDD